MTKRKRIVLVLAIVFLLLQLVPFGHDHTNPPVVKEPQWSSPAVAELVRRTCYDCHSNESRWPWYAYIAPVSWLVVRDVTEGREHLNFSEFDRPQRHAGDAAEEYREGEMPPWFYLPLHSEARLSASERETLIAGLIATLGESKGKPGEGEKD